MVGVREGPGQALVEGVERHGADGERELVAQHVLPLLDGVERAALVVLLFGPGRRRGSEEAHDDCGEEPDPQFPPAAQWHPHHVYLSVAIHEDASERTVVWNLPESDESSQPPDG